MHMRLKALLNRKPADTDMRCQKSNLAFSCFLQLEWKPMHTSISSYHISFKDRHCSSRCPSSAVRPWPTDAVSSSRCSHVLDANRFSSAAEEFAFAAHHGTERISSEPGVTVPKGRLPGLSSWRLANCALAEAGSDLDFPWRVPQTLILVLGV